MVSVNRGLSRLNLQNQHITINRIITVLQYPVQHGIQVAQVESTYFLAQSRHRGPSWPEDWCQEIQCLLRQGGLLRDFSRKGQVRLGGDPCMLLTERRRGGLRSLLARGGVLLSMTGRRSLWWW